MPYGDIAILLVVISGRQHKKLHLNVKSIPGTCLLTRMFLCFHVS